MKPNKKPNNGQNIAPKRVNVLDNYAKENGGTLKYMTPEEIQRYAIRIFKDMAYSNITSRDIGDKYVDFFSSPTVLENLKVVINQKYYDAKIRYDAIQFYFDNSIDGKTMASTLRGAELCREEYNIYSIYSIILNILDDAIADPRNTIRILFCVEYNLKPYRRYINRLV